MTPSAVLRLVASALSLSVLAACSGAEGAGLGITTGYDLVSIPADQRKPIPAFEAPVLVGEGRAGSSLLHGKVGVVNFWGTWCGPCRREQPALEALWREYRGREVQFLGVNTRGDQRAAALAYLREFDVSYPSLYDPDSAIPFALKVRVMPTTYVVDREGRIAARFVGALRSEDDLRRVLDEELAR